jgi:uncharacterized membrane protein YphA (DoxX/SURF4 family)
MVAAMVTVTFRGGIAPSASGSGYELNVALAAAAFAVMLLGTGRLGLDHVLAALAARRKAPGGAPGPSATAPEVRTAPT